MKIDNSILKIGDCFIFKNEKLSSVGLLLIDIKNNKNYSMTPIRLDMSSKDLNQFKKGIVYIDMYKDFTNSSGQSKGFNAYHFLSDKEFEMFYSHLIKVGNLTVKEEYLNIVGGTAGIPYEMIENLLLINQDIINHRATPINLEKIIN